MRVLTTAVFVATLIFAQQTDFLTPEAKVKAAVNELKFMLDFPEPLRFEIIFVEKGFESPVALDPEDLERIWTGKMVISNMQKSKLRAQLLAAVNDSTFGAIDTGELSHNTDMRWGCCFYDGIGHRMFTFYFNEFGNVGVVDGIALASNGKVVDVLKKVCEGIREP